MFRKWNFPKSLNSGQYLFTVTVKRYFIFIWGFRCGHCIRRGTHFTGLFEYFFSRSVSSSRNWSPSVQLWMDSEGRLSTFRIMLTYTAWRSGRERCFALSTTMLNRSATVFFETKWARNFCLFVNFKKKICFVCNFNFQNQSGSPTQKIWWFPADFVCCLCFLWLEVRN